MPQPIERVIKDPPVVRKLKDITKGVAVSFSATFCENRSKPVKVVVTVTCADGLSYEYERRIDG